MVKEAPIYNLNVTVWPNYYFGEMYMQYTNSSGQEEWTTCTAQFVKDRENPRSHKLVTAAHCVYKGSAEGRFRAGFPNKLIFSQACYPNGTNVTCLDPKPKHAKRICVLNKGINPRGFRFVSPFLF